MCISLLEYNLLEGMTLALQLPAEARHSINVCSVKFS